MRGLFHWYLARSFAPDGFENMPRRLAIHVHQVWAEREQSPCIPLLTEVEGWRPPALDCSLGKAGAMEKGHRVEDENHSIELFLNGERQSAFDVIGLRDLQRSNRNRF